MDKQKILMSFIDNLEKERTKLGLTQSQMAKELGKSLSGYKKMIAGEITKIDLLLACRVCELTGRYLNDLCGLERSGAEIERRLPELTPSQLNFISGMVEFEADFAVKEPKTEDYVTLMVLTGDLKDGMLWDSMNFEKINVAAYRRRFGEELDCAIKVNSTHLHPVYRLGDILLVSKQPPRDGDIGIFVNKVTGRGYFRKYHQTVPARLEPINGYGQEFTVDYRDQEDGKQWIPFGKVLTKMRS